MPFTPPIEKHAFASFPSTEENHSFPTPLGRPTIAVWRIPPTESLFSLAFLITFLISSSILLIVGKSLLIKSFTSKASKEKWI